MDKHLRTNVENVYAAGDVIGDRLLVYTAAQEGGLAAHNMLSPPDNQLSRSDAACPWCVPSCRPLVSDMIVELHVHGRHLFACRVVFTDPQVAGVGLDATEAKSAGSDLECVTMPFSTLPRAIVAQDTVGFVRLCRKKDTHEIVGARVIGREGGELVMQVALAIRAKMTSEELASMLYPYLTLSEAIKLAALAFDTDVRNLSCCASHL